MPEKNRISDVLPDEVGRQNLKQTIGNFILFIPDKVDFLGIVGSNFELADNDINERLRRFRFGMTNFVQDVLELTPESEMTHPEFIRERVENYTKGGGKESLEAKGHLIAYRAYQEFINVWREIKSGDITSNISLPYLLKAKGKMPPLDSLKVSRDIMTDNFSSLLVQEIEKTADLDSINLLENPTIEIQSFIDRIHKILSYKD